MKMGKYSLEEWRSFYDEVACEDVTVKQLANKIGHTADWVFKVFRKLEKGSFESREIVVSRDQIYDIYKLRQEGINAVEVGKQFNITTSYVYRLCKIYERRYLNV